MIGTQTDGEVEPLTSQLQKLAVWLKQTFSGHPAPVGTGDPMRMAYPETTYNRNLNMHNFVIRTPILMILGLF